jgi:hypothetical protein
MEEHHSKRFGDASKCSPIILWEARKTLHGRRLSSHESIQASDDLFRSLSFIFWAFTVLEAVLPIQTASCSIGPVIRLWRHEYIDGLAKVTFQYCDTSLNDEYEA